MVHHYAPECHAQKTGFYLQGQGHSVGLYNQNMTVSTISFISSKPVSLLQPNSIWVSSENAGLLCSRSMSQPRLKVSVNVSLDDILCIAEPFVTKPSMVKHHYKPERHMRKMGFYLQSQGHSNWISVHAIKYDHFYYMFWTADFLGATNLVWQCMWSVLWKGCFAVFKVKVTVKVLNFSECLPGQYLWLVKLSMVMHHHQPEYHSEISFCDVHGQSHSRFN